MEAKIEGLRSIICQSVNCGLWCFGVGLRETKVLLVQENVPSCSAKKRGRLSRRRAALCHRLKVVR